VVRGVVCKVNTREIRPFGIQAAKVRKLKGHGQELDQEDIEGTADVGVAEGAGSLDLGGELRQPPANLGL